ncbi:MAG: THUMP domain-containing protein [Dysgonamonadaceae bacterium]|jgi:putative N6-adenine-specific DNA methylase|nr:THUMP domain-containing protein [Dysgonamonadaceae bacterium]
MAKTFGIIAKTLYGLEDVLAKELISLGANGVQIGRRMVSFEGDLALLYKANIHCRTALRILKPIREFKAKDADELYLQVKRVDWDVFLSPQTTFVIDAVVNSETFTHSKFVTYRAKDAIADYFTERGEERPSVSVSNPDLRLHLHISHNDCSISIDSSGESLHKRGYREVQTEAPINEVLAAGMILKTGWKGDSDLIDPMCGSGTILIEAAMIALNIPPGIHRKNFAFEKWPDFNRELFEEIYNDDSREKPFNHRIIGTDISPVAIDIARKNIKSAGLSPYIDLKVTPLQQYKEAPPTGIVVMNPPYGERLSSQNLFELYQMIGERMKHVFAGYEVWILSYREECFDKIGLKPSAKIKLKNGSLDCEFRKYEIFAGKRKEWKKPLTTADSPT